MSIWRTNTLQNLCTIGDGNHSSKYPKKSEMVQFLMDFKAIIISKEIDLISTGTTGKNAEKAGFKVNKFLSGPFGGDA